MSRMRLGHWTMVFVMGLLLARMLKADPPVVDAETATLIEQLGREDLLTQAQALESLEARELNAGAVPLLRKVAEASNLKGQHAAIQLLVRLGKIPNAEVALAAREALTDLSKSLVPQVSAGALQALRVLEPVPPLAAPAFPRGRRLPPQMNRAFETILTTTIQGERQIHVRNQERKLEIKDRDGKEIEFKITETAGNKETTYTAKDVAELKQQHPEIALLYEKYTQPAKEAPGLGIAVPVLPPGFNLPGARINPAAAHKQIENSLARLTKIKDALAALDKESLDKAKTKSLLDELDAAMADLLAAQAQLGMR